MVFVPGSLQAVVALVVITMITDVLLGILLALSSRGYQSRLLREGLVRKAYLLLLGMVLWLADALTGSAFSRGLPFGGVTIGHLYYYGVFVAEVSSLLEKAKPLGLDKVIPISVVNTLREYIVSKYFAGDRDGKPNKDKDA